MKAKAYDTITYMRKLILASLFLIPALAWAITYPDKPAGLVLDQAEILTDVAALEQQLAEYEEKTTNEVYVVTVPDLQGLPVEQFALGLFNTWAIGKAEKNNGVLMLVSKSERAVRIEVGDGLTNRLTNGGADSIIQNTIVPKFKAGDFQGGVEEGLAQITLRIGGLTPFKQATAQPRRATVDTSKAESAGKSIGLKLLGFAFNHPIFTFGVLIALVIAKKILGLLFMFSQWKRQPPPGTYPPGTYPPGTLPPGAYPPPPPTFWGFYRQRRQDQRAARTAYRSSGSSSRGGGRSSGSGASGKW